MLVCLLKRNQDADECELGIGIFIFCLKIASALEIIGPRNGAQVRSLEIVL